MGKRAFALLLGILIALAFVCARVLPWKDVPWQIKPVYATPTQITYYPYTISSSGSYQVSGVNSSSTSILITITANDVYLDGQNYQLTGDGSSNKGIDVENQHNITIVNMNMTGFQVAIRIVTCYGVDVENSTFGTIGTPTGWAVLWTATCYNCTDRNLYAASETSNTACFGGGDTGGYDYVVDNVTGVGTHHTVLMQGCSNWMVENSMSSGGDSYPFLIEAGCSSFNITNCNSTSASQIEVDSCTDGTINKCNVVNSAGYGIQFYGDSFMTVTNCTMDNCSGSFGFRGFGTSYNYTVTQTVIKNTSFGFWDNDATDGNFTISLNNFVNDSGNAVWLQNTGNTTLLHNAYSSSGSNAYTSVTNNVVNDTSLGLTVTVVGSGTVSPSAGTNYVNGGNWSQTFTASPDPTYSLSGFVLNGVTVATSSPTTQAIIVDSNMTIVFTRTRDTTPPTCSSMSTNTTLANQLCSFNCLWADETNMSGYVFGTNNTGAWVNETWTSTWSNWPTTTSAWANVTQTLNSTVGYVVQYEWWANDTSNNWGSSDQYNLTVTALYRPNLQLSPDTVTCRKLLETFDVQINVTNAVSVQGFTFTIYYDASVLNFSSITWGELGTGALTTIDRTGGIIEGNVAGSPVSGNLWLLNMTLQADQGLVWKVGSANQLQGRIWFHQAQLNLTDNSTLQYVEGGINQIDVNQAAYTFLPIQGDVNNDGTVDVLDLRTVAFYYDKTPADPEWPEASKYDLKPDNAIDIFDLVIVASNIGFKYP